MMMAEGLRSARWFFDCYAWKPTHSELLKVFSSVQPEEKERIGKFVFMKDAKSSLVGRLLLRMFVCDSSGLPWDQIFISRDEFGKPRFPHNPEINFNVSHQGRYAVLAGEVRSGPVGIDVMEMKYRGGKGVSEFFRLMNSNFDPQEWQAIREPQCEADQVKMFYRFWCLKESYVKATGVGLTIGLRNIVFKISTTILKIGEYTSDTRLYISGIEQSQWEFQETLVDEDYCLSIALRKDMPRENKVPLECITIEKIMKSCKQIIPPDEMYCSEFLKKE